MVRKKPVGWRGDTPGHRRAALKGRASDAANYKRRTALQEAGVVKRLLKENASDLKVGTKIMMDAKQMMLGGHYRLGKKQLLGAEDVWAAKGELLLEQAKYWDSPALKKAGKAHVKAAHGMTKQILADVKRDTTSEQRKR